MKQNKEAKELERQLVLRKEVENQKRLENQRRLYYGGEQAMEASSPNSNKLPLRVRLNMDKERLVFQISSMEMQVKEIDEKLDFLDKNKELEKLAQMLQF